MPSSQSWRRKYSWTKVRRKAIVRDRGCVVCQQRKRLEVHHIADASYHPELRLELDNLMTLCYWCHRPMFHILFKGGTRRKTSTKDMRKLRSIAKYYMKRGRENE